MKQDEAERARRKRWYADRARALADQAADAVRKVKDTARSWADKVQKPGPPAPRRPAHGR